MLSITLHPRSILCHFAAACTFGSFTLPVYEAAFPEHPAVFGLGYPHGTLCLGFLCIHLDLLTSCICRFPAKVSPTGRDGPEKHSGACRSCQAGSQMDPGTSIVFFPDPGKVHLLRFIHGRRSPAPRQKSVQVPAGPRRRSTPIPGSGTCPQGWDGG